MINIGYGSGSEAVWSRRLIVHVLHGLAAIGWHVLVSADLTKKQYDKDSIFFKSGPPLQRYMFAVSFNESDKIRIIDAPNETVLEAFKTVVAVSASALPLFHLRRLQHRALALSYIASSPHLHRADERIR